MLVARALVTPTRTACLPPEVELSNRVVRHFRYALLHVSADTGGTAWDSSCIDTGHVCLPCSQDWHVGIVWRLPPLSLCQRCQHDIHLSEVNRWARAGGMQCAAPRVELSYCDPPHSADRICNSCRPEAACRGRVCYSPVPKAWAPLCWNLLTDNSFGNMLTQDSRSAVQGLEPALPAGFLHRGEWQAPVLCFRQRPSRRLLLQASQAQRPALKSSCMAPGSCSVLQTPVQPPLSAYSKPATLRQVQGASLPPLSSGASGVKILCLLVSRFRPAGCQSACMRA